MNKKIIYISLQLITLAVVIFAGYILFGKTKNRDLLKTIDKVYLAYSDFTTDLGYPPSSMQDLYQNTTNNVSWSGPYISSKMIAEYSEGQISLLKASHIPTKSCSLDSIVNCYMWISISNISNATQSQIKQDLNSNIDTFYAENVLFFKITQAE